MPQAIRKGQTDFHRETKFTPSTLDESARTVEVTAATETPVEMRGWLGPVREILRCDRNAINAKRLNGLPVLDSHNRDTVLATLGIATKWRIADSKLYITVKFADTESGRQAFDLVRDGMINKVSVGYRIADYDEEERPKGTTIRTVTQWEPYEVSLVSVPADHNASIRGKTTMAKRTIRVGQHAPTDEEEYIDGEDDRAPDRRRSDDAEETIDTVRVHFARGGMDMRTIDTALQGVETVGAARAALFAVLAEKSRQAPTSAYSQGGAPIVGNGRSDQVSTDIVDAIAVRLGGTGEERNNPMRSRSMIELGRELLASNGVDTRGMDDRRIGAMMLSGEGAGWGARAGHTTSDFPSLFQDGAQRALLERFQSDPASLKMLSRKRNQKDFRKTKYIRPGEAPKLQPVLESGELKHGTMSTESESFGLRTHGVMFKLSREVLINDDLGVIADTIAAFIESATATEGDLLYELLSANSGSGVTLADGNPFFHASHGNLGSPASVIDIANLAKARLAMRTQKNVNGTGTAGTAPAVLLVGPAKETEAETILAALQPTKSGDVNPFSGTKLKLMVENRITANAWYLFADPERRPAFAHGYLDGAEGPQIEAQDGWSTLGREYRCYLDFGCGPLDYRAAYMNPGA